MMTSGQRVVLPSCTICGALHEDAGCRNPKRLADNSVRKGEEADAQTKVTFSQPEASVRSRRILEVGFDALALLNIGLVICSASGHVLACNVPAQTLLTGRQGLEQAADGILACTEPAATPIAEIIQRVSTRNSPGRSSNTAILAVQRPAPDRPLTILVQTCSQPLRELGSAALVIILDSALQVKAIDSDLRELYGLTSTEARLANLLMKGASLEDCCKQMKIRRSTGCTHLRRLFKKTGAHRQSELVVLLLKGIGLARLGRSQIKEEVGSERCSVEQSNGKPPRIAAPSTESGV
jgi:DNA-binding CsgD family transcriptional regulator